VKESFLKQHLFMNSAPRIAMIIGYSHDFSG